MTFVKWLAGIHFIIWDLGADFSSCAKLIDPNRNSICCVQTATLYSESWASQDKYMVRYKIVTSLSLWNIIIYRHISLLRKVEKWVCVIHCIFIENGEISMWEITVLPDLSIGAIPVLHRTHSFLLVFFFVFDREVLLG